MQNLFCCEKIECFASKIKRNIGIAAIIQMDITDKVMKKGVLTWYFYAELIAR